MRDHIHREAPSHDIPAAWFVVPMSIAIIVLAAMAVDGLADTAPSAAAVPPAVALPDVVPPTHNLQPSDDVPAASDHVQAF